MLVGVCELHTEWTCYDRITSPSLLVFWCQNWYCKWNTKCLYGFSDFRTSLLTPGWIGAVSKHKPCKVWNRVNFVRDWSQLCILPARWCCMYQRGKMASVEKQVNRSRTEQLVALPNSVFRIVVVAKPRISPRSLFNKSEILTVACQCMA